MSKQKHPMFQDRVRPAISAGRPTLDQSTVKKGRPPANVFGPKSGSGDIAFILEKRRIEVWARHYIWTTFDKFYERLWSVRSEGSYSAFDMQVTRAGEAAMILMGWRWPESIYYKSGAQKRAIPFDSEVFKLLRKSDPERNLGYVGPLGYSKARESIIKTMVAAAAARSVIHRRTRNYRLVPSPREIAQIWYVLFGENESHEAIKSRLPKLSAHCLWIEMYAAAECPEFAKLRRNLNRRYAPKKKKSGPKEQ